MNIYKDDDDGAATVDLDAATTELKATSLIQNDEVRRQRMSEISAAALLDIALSLRVVAAEARAAMPELGTIEYAEGDDVPAERDFLVVGDLVAVDGLDDPAEVVGFGQSEGATYAKIRLVDGTEARAWLDTLTRLRGDERDDDTMQEAAEKSVTAIADDDVSTHEGESGGLYVEPDDAPADAAEGYVDDLDDDFEGDSFTAAESALDTLRANEAARKAAKKKGGKK